ncbi:MAG: hypothetical protein NZ534_07920, partial [Bacteroidia bacterium]|nr:hypothetical protein [Bacteroidia bacterium]
TDGAALRFNQVTGTTTLERDTMTFSGMPTSNSFGGVDLSGDLGSVLIAECDFDGGGVSGGGYGVRFFDNIPDASPVVVRNNFINGFGAAFGSFQDLDANSIQIFDNDLSGNTVGTSYLDPAGLIDASQNWWGSNDDDVVKAYVANAASIDFSPWFHFGTDTDAGTPGFQGDYSFLHIDDDSPIAGSQGHLQEAHDLLAGTNLNIYIHSTNYPTSYYDESVNLTQNFTLRGDAGDYPVVGNVQISGDNVVDVVDVNLVVQDDLTLTDGIFTTEPDNEIYVWSRDENAVSGHSDESYVQGRLRRNINATGSYDFPVGASGKGYQLANVEFTSATTTDNILVYFDPTPGSLPDFECVCSSKFYDVLDNGRWFIQGYDASLSPVAGDGQFNVTAYNQNFTPFVPLNGPAKYALTRGNAVGSTGDCFLVPSPVTRTGYNDFAETFYFTAAGDDSSFPAPDIDANPGTTVCEGQTLTLTASTPYFPQAFYWTLPDNSTFVGATLTLDPVALVHSGTFTVYALINDCPSDEATIDITVNPAPAAPTVTYNGPICTGADLEIEIVNPLMGHIYYFEHPNGVDVYQGSVLITGATTADAGDYRVYVEAPNGCISDTTIFTAIVYPVPATPIVDAPTVCAGQDLIATVTNPITVNNPLLDFYEWYDDGDVQLPENGPVLTLDDVPAAWDGLQYYVIAYENGCPSDTAFFTLDVNSPPADPDLSAPGTVCEGANFLITADNTTADSYEWYLNGFLLATTTDPELLTSIEVGGVSQNVTLSVIAFNGPCPSNEVSQIVFVEAAPPIPTITG